MKIQILVRGYMEHTPAAVRLSFLLAAVAVVLVAAALVAGRTGLLAIDVASAAISTVIVIGVILAAVVLVRVTATLGLR